MKIYFGFGIADSMFPSVCSLTKSRLTVEDVKRILNTSENVVPCLNPSHKETIRVMTEKFGINIPIPEKAPVVKLEHKDFLIVMAVSGLPRLEGRHEYTTEEIDSCRFNFSMYVVEVE